MNTRKFLKKDLEGLEYLEYVLDSKYGHWEVENSIYESIIWNLARCGDLATAQSKLDLCITILELYEELHCLVEELKTGDFFMNDIDAELLDKALKDLRGETILEGTKDETGNSY
ncbi:hypothetical protein [Bacillus salipaludis]|uniref:Uncharacterized protein n=1 Tax=Bacillus salipaludis TaxID=2547811 RepID=A0AA90QR23_9BACI|nr:hypothetical protein [Bacillus salipaludis]MDQ6598075.1 hypothetical protein [Bacillus salipaludis]